jgi:hypothetical protein
MSALSLRFEADQSASPSANVKNLWVYICLNFSRMSTLRVQGQIYLQYILLSPVILRERKNICYLYRKRIIVLNFSLNLWMEKVKMWHLEGF